MIDWSKVAMGSSWKSVPHFNWTHTPTDCVEYSRMYPVATVKSFLLLGEMEPTLVGVTVTPEECTLNVSHITHIGNILLYSLLLLFCHFCLTGEQANVDNIL